jgi:hypothetical protein
MAAGGLQAKNLLKLQSLNSNAMARQRIAA